MAKARKKSTTTRRPKSASRIPRELAEPFRVPQELAAQFRAQVPHLQELGEQFRQSRERAAELDRATKRLDEALAYQIWGIVPPWLSPPPPPPPPPPAPTAKPKSKSKSKPKPKGRPSYWDAHVDRVLAELKLPADVSPAVALRKVHHALSAEIRESGRKPGRGLISRKLGRWKR